jgi:hypothetical protein
LQDTYTKNKSKGDDGSSTKSQTTEQTSFIETGLRDEEKLTTVYHRYYHMFRQGELENLITANFEGRFKIEDSFFDHANWVVILNKLK